MYFNNSVSAFQSFSTLISYSSSEPAEAAAIGCD